MLTYCVTKLLFLEQSDTEANEISGDDRLLGETNETSDDDDDDNIEMNTVKFQMNILKVYTTIVNIIFISTY